MAEIRICFPIVWNGLIYRRMTGIERNEGGQVLAFEMIFSTLLDENNDKAKIKLTKWVRATTSFSAKLSEQLFDLEKNGELQPVVDSIKQLEIRRIRDVCSAFHYYLQKHKIIVGSTDMMAMEDAIRQNNPELYIVRALVAGLRYRKKQPGLSAEMLDELHTIENDPGYQNLFIDPLTESTTPSSLLIPSHIKEPIGLSAWRRLHSFLAQISEPDPMPPQAKRTIEEITDSGFRTLRHVCDFLLCEITGMFRRYYILAPEDELSSYDHPDLYASSFDITELQEMGLLRYSPQTQSISATPQGHEPFEGSNRDYALIAYSKPEAGNCGMELSIFEFTQTGNFLLNCLMRLTSEAYLRTIAHFIQGILGDHGYTKVVERKLDYLSLAETIEEERKHPKNNAND